MSADIWVAIIGLMGVIVTVLGTAASTQNKLTQKLQTQNEVQNTRINQLSLDIDAVKGELIEQLDHSREITEVKFSSIEQEMNILKTDISEHNHYAKLFSENLPVIKEKLSVANHRLDDAESEIRRLRD